MKVLVLVVLMLGSISADQKSTGPNRQQPASVAATASASPIVPAAWHEVQPILVPTEAAFTQCTYEGQAYDPGAIVCMGHLKMKCKNDGTWVKIGDC